MCYATNERYIDPFTDFGFKKIFGDTENTELLRSLINDILGFEGSRKVKSLKFSNGELLPDSPEDRKAIFDLYCKDENDNLFIVELQKVYQRNFQSRALYYSTFPIQQQATRGEWDFKLAPIYFIGLLNFEIDIFKQTPQYLHHGKIIDIYSHKVMYEELNMIYLEIPKLKKTQSELSTHLEWWIYVFQNLSRMSDIPEHLKGDVIEQAFVKADFLKLPKLEQEKYHQNLKVYRDLKNSFDSAKEKGKIEGERSKSIEIAKNLLKANVSMEIIVLSTGLSVEEIEKLSIL